MADLSEKQLGSNVQEHDHSSLHKGEVVETKLVQGDDNFAQAMIKEPPSPFNAIALQLYAICIVGFCCSTSNGFDSCMFGNLLGNDAFKAFFNVSNVGIGAGIVSSMTQIGAVTSVPFVGPAIDTWGRKIGMMIAGTIIVIGVVIQGTVTTTRSTRQFMGGRYLMGFGVNMISSVGPVYVIEICHPAYRGIVTGLYNVFWPVGALVASVTNRGCIALPGDQSWIIPIWLQMMFPGFVLLVSLFLPETPRWNYTNGKMDQAKAFLVKYHGNGNPDSEWVKLQMFEYESHLELEGADKRWWDYRALFSTRASRYRLATNCLTGLFGQWAGNGVVSYFLDGVFETAGLTDHVTKANLFIAMNVVQIVISSIGSCFVDKIGRRPMLIWVNVGCSICWVGVVAAGGVQHSKNPHPKDPLAVKHIPSSIAMIVMIYIFQSVYSFGWTPLQALYPVEVLSFEMRAKGMAFSGLFVNFGTLVNQFGFPESLKKIGWKTYLVFMVWCLVQAGLAYLFAPETKNRTLEELDDIFNAPNPKNASIEKKKLELDSNANVVGVQVVDKLHSAA